MFCLNVKLSYYGKSQHNYDKISLVNLATTAVLSDGNPIELLPADQC